MKVLINDGKGYVDYTKYVVDGTLTVEDSINVPTLTTFQLAASDNSFIIPSRSAYVRVISGIYADGGGYLSPTGVGKVLATGFVTNQPEPTYLGLNSDLPSQDYQQLQFSVNVTSDEWILNCQSVPYIPAFVNQTDAQILKTIAEAVTPIPGFFTYDLMASGTLIPYYQYDPSQTWSDIAKTFADSNRYYYKVVDGKIIYQPFGQSPTSTGLGIAYDETTQKEAELYPENMKTSVVNVPPVNDCIVLGDVEPQTNWDCYFVGDGFTSNFQLLHQVFQGTSSNLLSDDWTESSFSVGTWIVNDPENTISLVDSNGNALGALNIVQKGSHQVYLPIQDATYVQAQNGLELGGGLNLQHGQIVFNDTASGGGGIIGGVFEESTEYDPGHCLAGFAISGQPNLGSFTVNTVQGSASLRTVMLTISGLNTTLVPGNVFSCASFGTATWLNGQSLYIVSIQQLTDSNGNPTDFVLTCTPQNVGIIPGNYGPASDTGTITFSLNATISTASGSAGIYMYPLYNGALTGSPVVSQPNHQYVLQTWIGAQAPNRYTRSFTNLTQTATYGAQNLAASGTITWVITDVNIGNYVVEQQFPLFGLFAAAPPPVVTKFFATNVNLPPFAVYVLLSGLDLNVSINYTVVDVPPQGYLTVVSLTGNSGTNLPWLPSKLTPAIPYQLGFGMINQTAQISQQGQLFALSFYTDDIPSVGARIRFQSWSAGQSVARVQDPGAIASEARVSGDTGIRSAIMNNLSPLPRTSLECEAAAAAAILDREYPQWQGSYTIETSPWAYETLFNPSMYDYPHTGMFFYADSPVRGVSGQNFFVNTVRFQVVETRGEELVISIDFGPDLYLEKLLPSFLEREQNLLVPTQTVAPPNPITLDQVLNASLDTFNAALVSTISNSVTGNYIVVDLSGGTEPNAASVGTTISALGATGCEVRYIDSGWGTADAGRVGIFTVDQFTLPRTVRDQTFYLRGVNGSKFSRFSKALRVVYPLVPSAPALVAANPNTIVVDYSGDVRDIYGLELRALSASGISGAIIVQLPQNTSANPVVPLNYLERDFPLGVVPYLPPLQDVGVGYFHVFGSTYLNLMGPVSPTGSGVFTNAQIGDIWYISCPTDSSFNGFRVISYLSQQPPGVYDEVAFGTADFGLPYSDVVGNVKSQVGTAQFISRNGYAVTASGSMSGGVATIVTRSPHGLSNQQIICIAAFWAAPPVFNVGANSSYANDNSIFCGTWQVTTVIDAYTFQFNWVNANAPTVTSVANTALNGLVAGFPSSVIAFPFTIPGAAAGTLIQRPIFSPSDLVIDLTQPDIADALSALESITPGSRVGGLALYFFNLTWDYSLGTPVPTLVVPTVTGLVIDQVSQNLTWGISQGTPDGHRIETFDVTTGAQYSKFTIDHPSNPQLLKQSNIPAADWLYPRVFKVTPFDALGDGIPSFVFWGGSSGVGVIGSGGGGYPVGCGAQLTSVDLKGVWSANQGRFIASDPIAPNGPNNAVFVVRVEVPTQITVSTLTWMLTNPTSSGLTETVSFGLYSLDGNTKLIDSGPQAYGTTSVARVASGSFSPVTLPVGEYWFAVTFNISNINDQCTFLSLALLSTTGQPTAYWESLINAQSIKLGVAANSGSSGSLPATLGAITVAQFTNVTGLFQAIPLIIFE